MEWLSFLGISFYKEEGMEVARSFGEVREERGRKGGEINLPSRRYLLEVSNAEPVGEGGEGGDYRELLRRHGCQQVVFHCH